MRYSYTAYPPAFLAHRLSTSIAYEMAAICAWTRTVRPLAVCLPVPCCWKRIGRWVHFSSQLEDGSTYGGARSFAITNKVCRPYTTTAVATTAFEVLALKQESGRRSVINSLSSFPRYASHFFFKDGHQACKASYLQAGSDIGISNRP